MMLVFCLFMVLDQPIVAPQSQVLDLVSLEIFESPPMAVAPSGEMVILDVNGRAILVSADGSKHQVIGEKGKGPGEFERPVHVSWVPKRSQFVILDARNQNLSFWSVDGKYQESTPVDRGIFQTEFSAADSWLAAVDASGRKQAPQLVRHKMGEENTEVIWKTDFKGPPAFVRAQDKEGRRFMFVPSWAPYLHFGVGEGFVAVNFSAENQVHIVDESGQALAMIEPDVPTALFTEAHFSAELEQQPPHRRELLRKIVNPPESWPRIRKVMVDGRDRVWIVGAQAAPDARFPVAIYDKSGTLLGKLEMPSVPAAMSADAVYFTVDDGDSLLLKKHAFSIE